MSTTEVRLYECGVDGASYWIAAVSVFEALTILRTTVRDEGGDVENDIHVVSADEIGERRGKKLTFRDDESGGTRTMWEEFQRDRSPRLIACSEY